MRDFNWKIFLQQLSPMALGFFHIGLLFAIYQLFVLVSFIQPFDIYQLKQWDSYWYGGMAEKGYHFIAKQQSNTAFFPLFPLVWKILWKINHAGVEQICAFNTLMYLFGMTLLKKAFNFSWMYFLVFLSIPSNIFMYVPYTESLFFFFSSMVLLGLKNESKMMLIGGLFFASLARPSAVFFVPAIVGMELLHFKDLRTFFRNVSFFLIPPIFAIILVFLIQYMQTGVWFAFFKDGWSRVMHLPEFPLTTWGGLKNLWLDGIALFFGLLATFILIIAIVNKLKGHKPLNCAKAETFSLIYVMMALVTILMFGVTDKDGGSSLLSLNRFTLASAYFTIFLFYLSHQLNLDLNRYVLFLITAIFSLFILNLNGTGYNEYTLVQKFFYTLFMFCHIHVYLLISSKFQGKFLSTVYLINSCIQVLLLSKFSNGEWIG